MWPLLLWASQYEIYNPRIGLYNNENDNYDEVTGKIDYLPNDRCYKDGAEGEGIEVDCMRFALLFDYKLDSDKNLLCVFLISQEIDDSLKDSAGTFGAGEVISLKAINNHHTMPFYIMKDPSDKGIYEYVFSCEMSGEEMFEKKFSIDFGNSYPEGTSLSN